MQQPIDGETLDQILTAAKAANLDVTADQLRRWHRKGLLPRPRQVGLGRPSRVDGSRRRGTVVMYPLGTTAQLLALCELLKRHHHLDRAGWPLWWRGFDVVERYARAPLAKLAANLTTIRDATDGLDISMFEIRQGLSARDAARRARALQNFAALVRRIVKPPDERRLKRLFGLTNAREFLRLWVLFLGGRLTARDLEAIDLPLSFAPAELQLSQSDARQLVAQLSGAIRGEVVSAALNDATLADLVAVRDELRQWSTKLAPAGRKVVTDAFPLAAQKVAARTLDELPEDTQQIALLGFLAHRDAIAFAMRAAGELPSWLTQD
jgi:hypothetical protein